MNITNCVKCGGNVRSETIGWICENCKGFIDMDGNYHPHVEKPFMPHMTNGDRIRAMTDEELAWYIARATITCRRCPAVNSCEIKYPTYTGCEKCVADWLKQPAEEEV